MNTMNAICDDCNRGSLGCVCNPGWKVIEIGRLGNGAIFVIKPLRKGKADEMDLNQIVETADEMHYSIFPWVSYEVQDEAGRVRLTVVGRNGYDMVLIRD